MLVEERRPLRRSSAVARAARRSARLVRPDRKAKHPASTEACISLMSRGRRVRASSSTVTLDGHGPFDFFGHDRVTGAGHHWVSISPRRIASGYAARADTWRRIALVARPRRAGRRVGAGRVRALQHQQSGDGDRRKCSFRLRSKCSASRTFSCWSKGLDYDYTAKDEEFSTNSRSDVIWAVNLDFANKRIYELSIPRDMVATMPNGTRAKINQAQSDGGVKEAKSVISQFLGIPGFDRYVDPAHRRDEGVRRRDRRRGRRR